MNIKVQGKKLIFISLFIIAALIYFPGISGGFLFDDIPNLGEMRRYGDMSNWSNAQQFIFNGFSGPTGRPISLASFWLTHESWPNHPAIFKIINIIIHLLCGVLLYWVIKYILIVYKYEEKSIFWIAIVATAFWLLHPFWVSTTLYVIQRMTQLAMLFSLMGILGYLYGRSLILSNQIKAYIIMSASIGIATLLATYSKENGALLPFLILVIEFCCPDKTRKPMWQWRAIFLWLPSFAILMLLAKYINFSETLWSERRNFNQIERLYSEARIVTEYLGHLFIPSIEGNGLYQDGYIVSKSLIQPITTLYSIIFLTILFISALWARNKYPLYALAILFFFCGHLMESTFIGLELYFEHRNYMAAMLIFLPVAAVLYALSKMIKPSLVVGVTVVIIILLAAMTYHRAVLWSDSNKLKIYWAQENMNSPRAQVDLARHYLVNGQEEKANNIILKAIERRPESALLSIRLLRQKIDAETIRNQDFTWFQSTILKQTPEAQSLLDLRYLVEQIVVDEQRVHEYGEQLKNILLEMTYSKESRWNKKGSSKGLFLFLIGKIELAQGYPLKAYQVFEESLKSYKNAETVLAMVIEIANTGNYVLAEKFLNEVGLSYIQQEVKTDKRIQTLVDGLESRLKQDIQLQKAQLGNSVNE